MPSLLRTLVLSAATLAVIPACVPERPRAAREPLGASTTATRGKPEGAARRVTPAEALYNAGRFKEARDAAQAELAALAQTRKTDAKIDAMDRLALIQTRLAAFREAESLYADAEKLVDPATDAGQLALARICNGRAELEFAQARWDEALTLAKKAYAIRNNLLPADSLDLAESLGNLGFMLADMPPTGTPADRTRAETARRHLLRSFSIRRAASVDSAETGEAWNNLGVFFMAHDAGDFSLLGDDGETELSERCLKKGLEIRRKALGNAHADVAESLVNLAYYHIINESWEEADKCLKEALPILEKSLGKEHPDVAFTLNVLGELRQHQERPIEAEALLQRAQRIYENVFGPDHYFVASPLRNLQTLYNETNQPDKAKVVLKRLDRIRGREI